MKLYIGNLSYTTTEDTLREAFSNYGDVVSVYISKDKFTEQSKGFGFIEMGTEQQGERAIGGMNGKDIDGRRLRVSVAVDKKRSSGVAGKYTHEDRGSGGHSERFYNNDNGRNFRGARFNRDERNDRGDRFDRGNRFSSRDRKPFRDTHSSNQNHEERTSYAEEF